LHDWCTVQDPNLYYTTSPAAPEHDRKERWQQWFSFTLQQLERQHWH
jgi:hypothetical protein